MFSLKSELFKKQQELGSRRSANVTVDAIRKQHKIKSATETETKVPQHEKNPGVEERNARDLIVTSEEEDKSKMVKSVLEAKAKLYEKMSSGNVLPDEESSSMFLVDFEQKSIKARMEKRGNNLDSKPKTGVNVASELSAEIQKASSKEEEWVEYTDSLGRTRTCLRKDLPKMKRMDEKLNIDRRHKMEEGNANKTLLSDDMKREMERERWEEEAMEEVNGPIHYENLRGGEIRELGVGYYAFSTDQETREMQMKMLRKMREETKKERENIKETERKKRSALQARLEKVRQGRIKKLKAQGKEIPEELLKPVELPPVEEEKRPKTPENDDVTIAEISQRDDSDRPQREWDEGKEWTPAEAPKLPKSWKNPRDERPEEFAPPSFYFNSKKKSRRNDSVDKDLGRSVQDSNLDATTPPSVLETPSDLISRIRSEINHLTNIHTQVQKLSSSANPKPEAQPKTDTQNSSQKNEVIPEEKVDPGLYVPSTDKPVMMKVKSMPKKNVVLDSKPAFSED